MSDLISRSEAVQRLIQETVYSKNNLIHINTVKRLLQDVDTAYDIDQVVEELESNSFITVKQEEVQAKRKDIQSYISVEKEVVLLKDAIEIVKHGCVDDYVCEWNLDGVYIFSPHSKMFSCVIDDKHRYTYCPVCGKKIKVVE